MEWIRLKNNKGFDFFFFQQNQNIYFLYINIYFHEISVKNLLILIEKLNICNFNDLRNWKETPLLNYQSLLLIIIRVIKLKFDICYE